MRIYAVAVFNTAQRRFEMLSHSVIPEEARLSVRLDCSFGAPGGLQVEVVVQVSHPESRLQESRGSQVSQNILKGALCSSLGRNFNEKRKNFILQQTSWP